MLTIKRVQTIIKLSVFLALLTPLVYIPQTIFGSIFGKAIYFQIIIELALPFFLYLIFIYKDFRPKIDLFTKFLLLFFVGIVISSLLGLDFLKSFWGYDERMRGIFILLHFLLFYFYIITVFKTNQEKKRLLLFFIIVGVCVSLFGILERLNPDIRIDKSIIVDANSHRISATTGNSIFLAGYLIFVFFISWLYFAWYKDKSRFIALSTIVLSGIAMLATGTRSATLGLLAGILVILFLLFILSTKKQKLLVGVSIFLLVLLSLFSYIFNIGNFTASKYNILNRVTNISLEEASGQQRLLLWSVSWKAFLAKPFFGWGLENFDYAYDRHYDIRFLRYNINQTWADRAHNIFFDILVMGGILNLILYLILFVYIFYTLLRRYLTKQNLSLIGLFVAFLVYSLFGLDSPSINLSLFFSFAVFYLFSDKNNTINNQNKKNIGLFIILLIPVIFLIYNFNIKPLYAGIDFINFLHTSDIVSKKNIAEKVLNNNNPYQDDLRQRFANEVFIGAGKISDTKYVSWSIDRAIEEIGYSYLKHKQEFSYAFTLGNLYLRKASIFNTNDYDIAIKYYNEALELSPKRQAVIFQLGTTYLLKGDKDKAINLLKDVVALDEESGQSYWRLAMAYLANNDKEEAYKNISRSVDLGFIGSIQQEVLNAISLCIEKENYLCVTEGYINLGDKTSGSIQADYYAKTATAFFMWGNKEHAIDYTNKAIKADPTFKDEGQTFLQLIDNNVR